MGTGENLFPRKNYDHQFYLWLWASKFKYYCFIKDGSNCIEIKLFEINYMPTMSLLFIFS